jgi:hypothetical protein
MTLFRVQHNKNYVTVNNYICEDAKLSWKAKGLWLYAFSRPDDWVFRMTDLCKRSTDGRDSVRSGLKELEDYGYLQRDQGQDEKGKFEDAEYTFFETPREDLKKSLPQTGFPSTVFPATENPPLLSIKEQVSIKELLPDASASEKIAPMAVVVFPCLNELNIPDSLKIKISKENALEKVEESVKRCKNWIGRSNDSSGILTCLKRFDYWTEQEKTNDPIENKNKSIQVLTKYKVSSKLQINILNSIIEFLDGSMNPICVNFSDFGFMDQLENAIQKMMGKNLMKKC